MRTNVTIDEIDIHIIDRDDIKHICVRKFFSLNFESRGLFTTQYLMRANRLMVKTESKFAVSEKIDELTQKKLAFQ